jgi:hypothetical protein
VNSLKLLRQKYPAHTAPIKAQDLKNTYEDIGKVVNGGLEFGSPTNKTAQNLNGVWFTGVTPVAPNTEFTVPLNLGRIPTGFITFSIDQAGILYRSTTTWTATTAFLKCNVASAHVVIFLT